MRTSTFKTEFFQQNLRVGYKYIEESFDTIFYMGYVSGKSPMGYRVKSCAIECTWAAVWAYGYDKGFKAEEGPALGDILPTYSRLAKIYLLSA